MKKFAIILLTILIAGLFVACNQEVTVDAQVYANVEVGTFVLDGQNYATLQEAVNAKLGKGVKSSKATSEQEPGVIYLMRDASGPGAVIDKLVAGGVIIDFNDFTYSFTNVTGLQGGDNPKAETFGLGITNGADVTLRGLQKIDLNDKTTTDLTMVYVEGATTSLTIEDAPKMEVANSQYVFWAANGATLTIGSNSETAPTTITGKIAATGGTEQTSKPVVTFNSNTKIEASELKADSAVVVINTSEDSSIGSFVGANEANIVVSGTGDVTVTKNNSESAATYTIENTSSTTPGESATVIVPTTDGTERIIDAGDKVEDDSTVIEESTSVARIGSKLYATLVGTDGAIDKASGGDTIVLLKDITVDGVEINKSITIDGNGKKITQNGTSTTRWFVLVEPTSSSGDITANLKNLEVESVYGNISTESAFAVLYDSSAEYKTTGTVENCKVTGPSVGLASAGSTISSSHTFNGSEVTIINSTISSTGNNTNQKGIYNAALSPQMGGVINVVSGSFDGIWSIAEYTSMGRISIEGGSFSGPILVYGDQGYEPYSSNENNSPFHLVKVSGSENPTFDLTKKTAEGSKYTAVSSIEDYANGFVFKGTTTNNPNKLILSCGTYSVDPSAYVAEGYEAVKDGDFWIVKKSDPVAVNINTGTEYFSLQKAFDEAGDGHTIKILKNISISSTTSSGYVLTIDKSITVDGDNKALTIDRSGNPRVANGLLIESENTSSSDDVNVTMQNLTLTFKGCKYGLIAQVDGTGTENVILKDMIITSDEGAPVVAGDSVVLSGNTTIKNQKILNVPGNFIASDTIGGEGSAGGGTWYYAGAVVWGGGNLTVEDGVYISGPVAIEIMNSGGTVTVKDGAEVVCIADDTNGFTETNYMFGNALYCDAGGNMLVQGGTITGGLKTNDTGSISITGGTFDHNPSAYVDPGYYACLGSDLKYHVHGNDNSTHVIQHLEGNKHKVVCSVYGDQAEHDCDTSGTYDECSVCGYHATQVAVVVKANNDQVYFDSWNSFVSQATTLGAASDYTLVMLQDVNSTEQKQVVFGYNSSNFPYYATGYGKNYVFDLYGKSVSLTGFNNAEGTIQIAGNHTLTIKDSSSSHSGILTLTSESDMGGIFIRSQVSGISSMNPTLNIESGTIVSNCNSRGAINMTANNSSVNITGGEIVSDNYGIYSNNSSYKVNMTNGIIRAAGGVFKAIEGTTAGTRTGGQFFENGVDVTSEYLTN